MSEFSATTKPDGSQDLMDEGYSKIVDDLTREQEQEIIDKIIALPSASTSEFATSLETDIVPEGFGLSMSDLLTLVQEERWKDYDSDICNKAQSAAESTSPGQTKFLVLTHFIELNRIVQLVVEEAEGDTSQKDLIWTREATEGRNQLSDEQRLEIIEKINNLPSDNVSDFVKALETTIIPKGFGLSLMDIQAVVHPDKWVNASPKTRDNARTAFTST